MRNYINLNDFDIDDDSLIPEILKIPENTKKHILNLREQGFMKSTVEKTLPKKDHWMVELIYMYHK